jgi:hypothetical protein
MYFINLMVVLSSGASTALRADIVGITRYLTLTCNLIQCSRKRTLSTYAFGDWVVTIEEVKSFPLMLIPCLYHIALLFCKPSKVPQVQVSNGIPEEQEPPRMFTVAYLYTADQDLSNNVFIVILRQSFIFILLHVKALQCVVSHSLYRAKLIKSPEHILRDRRI